MREDLFRGLSHDQIERARRCSDHAELLRMAKAEGVELTDEQLEAINGGACSGEDKDDKKDKGPTNNPF